MDTTPDLPRLPLDSPRWSELEHAYGAAADIPALLRDLADAQADQGAALQDLWSALAHQDTVYTASFAALPHVVRALAAGTEWMDADYLDFVAWVEVCRRRSGTAVPADLQDAYAAALAALPGIVAAAAAREWDERFVASALGALAAAKGFPDVAEAVLEMTPDTAAEFLEWRAER